MKKMDYTLLDKENFKQAIEEENESKRKKGKKENNGKIT